MQIARRISHGSWPNTEKLRDLQGPEALRALLAGVMAKRGEVPVFLKIAPDLSDAEIAGIAAVAMEAGVAGIIATNTTLSREGLVSRRRGEAGGLSGRPLFVPWCWRGFTGKPGVRCR